MTHRVESLRAGALRDSIRIDRATVWGNPYRINEHGTRSDVLRLHEDWLRHEVELVSEIWRLRGLSLACWCDPLPCHGWLLFYLANCTEDQLEDWLLGDRFWTPDMLKYRSVIDAPGCWRKLDDEL